MFRDDEWEGWDELEGWNWEDARILSLGWQFDSIRRLEDGDFYLFVRLNDPNNPPIEFCRLRLDGEGARGFKVQHLGEEELMHIEVALAPKEEEEEE